MTVYTVVYERGDRGWWLASVPALPGCHTQGRTIDQARRRIREALSLWVDDADTATIVDDIRLPANVARTLVDYQEARRRVEQERVKAQELTAAATRALTGDLHLSVRDASELLGLSHQRVQQIVANSGQGQSAKEPVA